MNEITQASLAASYSQQLKVTQEKTDRGNTQVTASLKTTETLSAEYTKSSQAPEAVTYEVDMEKVNAMKAETDQRLFDLFKQTVNDSFLKQVGGLRGVLQQIINGESVEGFELGIEITDETIAQAQEDVAEGGYWSPEETSDRFMDFAKALSGDNPQAADTLINAFKEGYAAAEDLWGGNLPEISQKTYDMTLEKFEAWKNGETEAV